MAKTLNKPCTDKERFDFIVNYNRRQGLKIEETDIALYALEPNEIMVDGIPQVNIEYEAKQQAIEQELIGRLTMTPLDFINFLVASGLTLEQINEYLESNLAVKMQLTYCSNVYCGVVCKLLPITIGDITITAEMVVAAFKEKHQLV